jgi:hypothetical protein
MHAYKYLNTQNYRRGVTNKGKKLGDVFKIIEEVLE